MNSLENLSLSDVLKIRDLVPDLAHFVDIFLAVTFDDFVRVLYSDLDRGVRNMEDDPCLRQEDNEDRLTSDLSQFLSGRGYRVSHDEKIGGHCDLVVRHPVKEFRWLGEAKIHRGRYDYLLKGFNQLCSRYARGTPDSLQGGLIIYIRSEDAKSIMENWRSHLEKQGLDGLSVEDCPLARELAFFSNHKHQSSGLSYKVRHRAVVLHFDPKDRKP